MNHRQHPWIGQKSLADRLIERTDLDVYIIPDRQPLYKKPLGKLRKSRVRFSWRDAVVTLLCLAISTAVGFAFDWAGFSESNIITIYILGVLVTAVSTSGICMEQPTPAERAGVQLLFYRAALHPPG